MSPSAVAGSCITRRADARTPIAPNSRTADRSTSSEVAAFGTHARDVWSRTRRCQGRRRGRAGRLCAQDRHQLRHVLVERAHVGRAVAHGGGDRLERGAEQLLLGAWWRIGDE